MTAPQKSPEKGPDGAWDHGTHEDFYKYYAEQSLSETTLHRFREIRESVLRVLGEARAATPLDVADIGCGAGTQCRLWAELGHRVVGLDVNEPLIQLGRERACADNLAIDLRVGSATDLPLASASMDVCLVPELLEHVADWESCVKEFARILRPGGLLYLTTTNKLCPVQNEFNLPMYGWYPGFIKRRYETLAATTRPEIANHAKYPAVNWFSYFGLRKYLDRLDFDAMDRFDLLAMRDNGPAVKVVSAVLRYVPGMRLLAHMATPYVLMIGVKRPQSATR